MNSKDTIIIAEAGINHNGNLEIAKRMIDVASEAGADYVKFQTFKTEKLVSKKAKKAQYQLKNSIESSEDQFEMLKKLELDKASHEILIDYCNLKKIKFLSTAFDLDSIDLLDSLKMDFFKIPSGEITNLPFLEKVASKQKPVIMSTGMANLGEIEAALNILTKKIDRDQVIILHCNTEYPTPIEDVNLKAMNTIQESFKVKVGYSDHTLGIEVPIAAVACGAVCIEKHFTLDRKMEGPDHRASLEPKELNQMVRSIRKIERAMGDGLKRPSKSEQKNIDAARKSIHINKDLFKGHILLFEDLEIKRPGDGITPMNLNSVLGRRLNQSIEKGTMLNFKYLS